MKKYITAILVLLYSFIVSNVAFATPDTWTQKADFEGNERISPVYFSIGDKGYVGTGVSGSLTFNLEKDFWEYDPGADTWTQKADFEGGPRWKASGFSIGNKGYIGLGGNSSTDQDDFWEYDPDHNTWTQKTDFGGIIRGCTVGFSIDDKGYLGTGDGSGKRLKEFWEYDPVGDTWTQKADFGGGARQWATGFAISNKGYIGMGMTTYYNKDNLLRDLIYKDFWEYNSATNTWIQKADFKGGARLRSTGFSIGSKGYIGTGVFWDESYNYTYYKDLWEYDPVTDTWIKKADFGGTPRSDAIGFSIGNKGYIGMGTLGREESFPFLVIYAKDFWEYEPGTIIKIRIHPYSSLGSKINIAKDLYMRVAILSSRNFSPLTVDINKTTLTFGVTGDEQSLVRCDLRNSNKLECIFSVNDTGFKCGDTTGILKGKTSTGEAFIGTDILKIVPCK